jgi:hypothetical protein
MNLKEKIFCMKAEHWQRVTVRGIAPFTIDKVTGTAINEWSRTGRSLPLGDWVYLPVTAWDLRHPDGRSERFATLREARAKAATLAAERRK